MQGHFYGHLDFDLDKTIYMFSGRVFIFHQKYHFYTIFEEISSTM